MPQTHVFPFPRSPFATGLLLTVVICGASRAQSESGPPAAAAESGELPAAFGKPAPESLEDLLAMERHLESLIERLAEVTVGVRIGPAQGSGVIVSDDGYVLTAGHVSGEPGRPVQLLLSSGEIVQATTLGRNRTLDAGLIRIDGERTDWPHVEMADAASIELGAWCLATGHPGGFFEDRPPVFRLGRVIFNSPRFLQTDCELVGGDSGGPLFDMHGRVIGINSRIGRDTDLNFHVPMTAFHHDWDRLAAGESFRTHSGALLGVSGTPHELGLEITQVYEDEPAEAAGVRVGDILVTFAGRRVTDIDELYDLVGRQWPGRRIKLQLIRDGEPIDLTVRLGIRWD